MSEIWALFEALVISHQIMKLNITLSQLEISITLNDPSLV